MSTGLPTITTSAFAVTPGTPAKLILSTPPPSQVAAGVPFGLTVAITDAYDNVVTSDNGVINIALASKQAAGPLNGTMSLYSSGGLAAFSNLTMDTAASNYSIQAASNGLGVVNSGSINVVPAAATTLIVSAQPPTVLSAGAEFGMAIAAEDPYGNIATSFSGDVTLSLRSPSGQGTLSGGPLTLAATNGLVGFPPNLSIDKAGSGYQIVATSPGLASAASTLSITVTGLPSTQLGIEVEPPSTLAPGATFGLVVAAVNQYGNVDPNFSGQFTISLVGGGGTTLGGVTTLTTSGGEASFQGLTLSNLSSLVTIQATSSVLGSVTTTPIAPTVPSNSSANASLVIVTGIAVRDDQGQEAQEGHRARRQFHRRAECGSRLERRRVRADRGRQEKVVHGQERQEAHVRVRRL